MVVVWFLILLFYYFIIGSAERFINAQVSLAKMVTRTDLPEDQQEFNNELALRQGILDQMSYWLLERIEHRTVTEYEQLLVPLAASDVPVFQRVRERELGLIERIGRTIAMGYDGLEAVLPKGLRRSAGAGIGKAYLCILNQRAQRLRPVNPDNFGLVGGLKVVDEPMYSAAWASSLKETDPKDVLIHDLENLFKEAATSVEGGHFSARESSHVAAEIVDYMRRSPLGHPGKYSLVKNDSYATWLEWHP